MGGGGEGFQYVEFFHSVHKVFIVSTERDVRHYMLHTATGLVSIYCYTVNIHFIFGSE